HPPVAGHEDRPAVHLPAVVAGAAPVRVGRVRVALPGAAGSHAEPVLAELADLADTALTGTRRPLSRRASKSARRVTGNTRRALPVSRPGGRREPQGRP